MAAIFVSDREMGVRRDGTISAVLPYNNGSVVLNLVIHLQFLGLVKLSQEQRKWRGLCAFRVFPWKCETGLKIFELDDGYIQPENKSLSNQ
ncbi:hypothetical protein C5167_021542 [Papaver somniferum]|nr:hypothetical protein C5167_021542 [Papaver somniferum]